jgi:TadE-like protein
MNSARLMARRTQCKRCLGSAAIEWLVAAPILLLLGLSTLQWGLLFFARNAVEFALTQAAREGAQGYAQVDRMESGLARGLIPFWGLGQAGQPLDLALPRALLKLNAEKNSGALTLRQLSPTHESFVDWAVPARDGLGDPIADAIEIPNDALQFQNRVVGSGSGQSLRDANLLRLELRYGVPLNVPLVAPMIVRLMEQINGCQGGVSAAWACSYYRATDDAGQARLRWPIQFVTMVRMQTPARRSNLTASRQENPYGGANVAAGSEVGSSTGSSTPTSQPQTNPVLNGQGASSASAPPASTGSSGSGQSSEGSASGGSASGGSAAGPVKSPVEGGAGPVKSTPASASEEALARIEQQGQAQQACPSSG